jgi:phosphomannomutase
MFAEVVTRALQSVGVTVVDCGLIPTPTAQLAVEHHAAAGGIVITASHNPVEWNALKFVGPDGLFLNKETAQHLFDIVARDRHLDAVLNLELVDVGAIRRRGFTVALDCVRGAGGTIMPRLLEQLGCKMVGMDLETDGDFPRSPEPIPANLSGLGDLVRRSGADLGIAVDPDVDRLAVLDEVGKPIGEDYTLAFSVRAVLARREGGVVTNLSTSLVVDDAAREHGATVQRAPVGEANVADMMKRTGAVIGGEGNGGVMLPDLHLGRDAPVAASLVLGLLADTGKSVSELVASSPRYSIVKSKADRRDSMDSIYSALEQRFRDAVLDKQDGLRLAWSDSWLHVRPSGTEPIVRMIAEAPSDDAAMALVTTAQQIMET